MELSAAAVCGHSLLPCGLVFGSGLAAQIIAPPMLCSLTNFVTFLSLSALPHAGGRLLARLEADVELAQVDAAERREVVDDRLVVEAHCYVPNHRTLLTRAQMAAKLS